MIDGTTSSSASEERERVHFWCMGLLASLDRNVFKMSPYHHVRVERLLDLVGPQSSVERLRTLIAPVVVTNAEQQRQFDLAFDAYLRQAVLVDEAPTTGRRSSGTRMRTSGLGGASLPAIAALPPRLPMIARWFIAAALIGVSAVGIAKLVHQTRTTGPDTTGTRRGPVVAPPPNAQLNTVREPELLLSAPFQTIEPPFSVRHRNWFRAAALFLPLAFAAGVEWRRRRRRRLVAERAAQAGAPIALTFTIPQPTRGPFSPDNIHKTARETRRRQRSDVMNLSIPRSVSATVEALGFPTLVFTPATRPPEYLVLVERSSPWDHQASYYESIVDLLDVQGAIVSRYSYQNDPRLSFPKGSRTGVWLEELGRLYPNARLVIIGSGHGFIDPLTGSLADWLSVLERWEERAFLSTVVPPEWSRRETLLAREMILLPATLEGAQSVADYFDASTKPALGDWRRRLDAIAPPVNDNVSVTELREYFGNDAGFRWLCACATYTELRWDLTLRLSGIPSLETAALTEENLLRLVALPWFRRGALPDRLKLALLAALDEIRRTEGVDIEAEARQAVNAVLATAKSVPAPSIAAERRERDRLLNDLYLYREDSSKRRKTLRELRDLVPRQELVRDATVVRLASGLRRSRLVHVLPDRLRDLLFMGGEPGLGVRGSATAIAAASFAGVAFLSSSQQTASSVEVTQLAIEPQTVMIAEGDSARFVLTGTLKHSTSGFIRVVWERDGVQVRSDSARSVDTSFSTVATLGGDYARARPIELVGRAHDIRAGTAYARANAGIIILPKAPQQAAYRTVLLRPRLILVGQPFDFAGIVSDASYGQLGTKPEFTTCGNASNSVVIAKRPGWLLVRATYASGETLVPVYASVHLLTADERQRLLRIMTEPISQPSGLHVDSIGTVCVTSGLPALLRSALQPGALLALDTDGPIPPAGMSDSAARAAVFSSEYSGIWQGADRSAFVFRVRFRSAPNRSQSGACSSPRCAQNQVSGTFDWTLIDADTTDVHDRVGDAASESVAGTFDVASGIMNLASLSVTDTTLLGRAPYRLRFDSTFTSFAGVTDSIHGSIRGSIGFLGSWNAKSACSSLRPTVPFFQFQVGETKSFARVRQTRSAIPLAPWRSVDTTIATVQSNGDVTAQRLGQTVVVFHCATYTDTVRVLVSGSGTPGATIFSSLPKTVYFDLDKAEIRQDAQQILDLWAKALASQPSVRIRVEGHTSDSGNTGSNLALGTREAQAVKQFLVQRGIDAGRIDVMSHGAEQPVCREYSEACSSQNRRAVLAVTSSAPPNAQKKP